MLLTQWASWHISRNCLLNLLSKVLKACHFISSVIKQKVDSARIYLYHSPGEKYILFSLFRESSSEKAALNGGWKGRSVGNISQVYM